MSKPYVRVLLFGVVAIVVGILLIGVLWVSTRPSQPIGADTAILPSAFNTDGFARAIDPWLWEFPRDHGPHPEFQSEWWYYTGNLTTASGRRFGFQFTIFRRALLPERRNSKSEWYSNQIYMAHFTVSDIAAGTFYQEERFSRGAADLAGAEISPRFRVWLDDWSVQASDDSAATMSIHAKADGYAIELVLTQVKGPALQGVGGLSQKGPEIGNASYYYSLTRLATEGTVIIGGEEFRVGGTSWMDREFGTSALSEGAVGWDWFALQLSDGRDLMVGQIRREDDSTEPAFGGLLVSADGQTRYLPADAIAITPRGTWQSKHSGATYPAGWEIAVAIDSTPLRLFLEPLLADQEVRGSVTYWEGAVRVSGDATGYGYAELTGYAQPIRGIF